MKENSRKTKAMLHFAWLLQILYMPKKFYVWISYICTERRLLTINVALNSNDDAGRASNNPPQISECGPGDHKIVVPIANKF